MCSPDAQGGCTGTSNQERKLKFVGGRSLEFVLTELYYSTVTGVGRITVLALFIPHLTLVALHSWVQVRTIGVSCSQTTDWRHPLPCGREKVDVRERMAKNTLRS